MARGHLKTGTLYSLPDEVPKAWETLEPNIPAAHREPAGRAACVLLAVLRHASRDIEDLADQAQQLQREEEALQRGLAVAERTLLRPEESPVSSRESSAVGPHHTPTLVQPEAEIEELLAPGAGLVGPRNPPGIRPIPRIPPWSYGAWPSKASSS